ncbi:MAG: type II toxin-antitoxin system Phd/YefM family antitoxin [Acidimicrobiaceae bacterium]|nr:type II toxin-antitoxin system Phd/YefM family antitoxin [Acidimicrobiaceae bacterium]MDE0497080.1 type II toxin-antitoxin system Phd/YefM family antitoxin [Acidimicrobiaceae bacterium]
MASEPVLQTFASGATKASNPVHTVAAADFKARCLKILDEVRSSGTYVIITKHGHPVAKLVPVDATERRPKFIGACKGEISYAPDETFADSTTAEMDAWEWSLDEQQSR